MDKPPFWYCARKRGFGKPVEKEHCYPPLCGKKAPEKVYSMKDKLIPAGAGGVFGAFCIPNVFFRPCRRGVSTMSTGCGTFACGYTAQAPQGFLPMDSLFSICLPQEGGLFPVILQADGNHLADALLLHGHTVQGIAALHGALAVRNDDKLRV